jgi:hypothetical protein
MVCVDRRHEQRQSFTSILFYLLNLAKHKAQMPSPLRNVVLIGVCRNIAYIQRKDFQLTSDAGIRRHWQNDPRLPR